MSESILIAIITVIGSVAAAVLAANRAVGDRLDTIEKSQAAGAVKLDTLWRIYAEDAISEARRAGLVQRNSPIAVTHRWEVVMPDSLLIEITQGIERAKAFTGEPYDVSLLVVGELQVRLSAYAREADVPMRALVGAIHTMAERALGAG